MDQPEMLSMQMVKRALSDPAFRSACPEFASLPVPAPAPAETCHKCGDRSRAMARSTSFFDVVAGLDAAGQQRLKTYFGISKLMINVRDPKTRGLSLKVV